MMLWLLHLPPQFPPHPIEKRSQPPAELALVILETCNSKTFDESHTLGSALAAAPSRIPSPWLLLPDTSHTRSAPRLVHTRQSTPSGAHNTQNRATKAPRRPARHNRRRNGSAAAAAAATAVGPGAGVEPRGCARGVPLPHRRRPLPHRMGHRAWPAGLHLQQAHGEPVRAGATGPPAMPLNGGCRGLLRHPTAARQPFGMPCTA